eukprot:435964-Alexandrium_andersonii.AAC.1
MGAIGRALLDEVNEAARALQAAVDEAAPCSPSPHAYVQPQINALRHVAGRAALADVAAGSSAPAPATPSAGTFEHLQA